MKSKAVVKKVVKKAEEAKQPVTATEPINPVLLVQLRAAQSQINALNASIQSAIGGYIAGRGLSGETHTINVNIETGVMSATPK